MGSVVSMLNIEKDENGGQQVNPWISVWLHPRKTVQFVVEFKTGKFVFLIAMLSGILLSFDLAVNDDLVASWNITYILLFSLVVGPTVGVLGFYLISATYHLFSKMVGGNGTSEQTRKAFAVSEMILIVAGILLILDLLIVGQTNDSSGHDLSVGQSTWLVISSILNFVAGIWSTIAFIAAISEVHRFSIWKATFVVFLPIIILILVSIVFFGLPFSS